MKAGNEKSEIEKCFSLGKPEQTQKGEKEKAVPESRSDMTWSNHREINDWGWKGARWRRGLGNHPTIWISSGHKDEQPTALWIPLSDLK